MAWVGPPEFLNTSTLTYPAVRDRVILSKLGGQKGVYGDTDFLVAANTLMALTVQPGDAMVAASHPTLSNKGLYHVNSTAVEPVTIPTANGSNPRLDQIVLVVQDPSYDPALVSSTPTIQVVQGTPTAGATLDNRTGAAATLPPSSLRIADVLVPTGATTILAANIRDRRPWTRGVNKRIVYTGGDLTTSNIANPSYMTGAALRAEITGDMPVEVTYQFAVSSNTANQTSWVRTGIGWSLTGGLTGNNFNFLTGAFIANNDGAFPATSTQKQGYTMKYMMLPTTNIAGTYFPASVGSVAFFPYVTLYETPTVGFAATLHASAANPVVITVREIPHGITGAASFPSV